jgi:FKBP-type peptidyl-prolyl cis-trans isomerase
VFAARKAAEVNYDVLSRRIKPIVLLALLPAAALPSCHTDALTERRMQAVSANSPTPSPAAPKVATREERKATLNAIARPERDAPADARTAAGGVLWTLSSAGAGEPPSPDQAVNAEVTVWKTDGSLVYSTYEDAAGLTFDLRRLPQALRAELVQVRPGGRARFWLPASALAGWKPDEWPDEDLIIDYQLIQTRPPQQVSLASRQTVAGTSPAFPPPAPGEPPPTARRTHDGIAHLSLREGEHTSPIHSDTLRLRINAWTIRALMVSKLVEGHELALRLDRAAPLLRPTLARMKAGGVERLWLPASLADSVLPSTDKKNPTVIDVELVDISS